MTAGRRAAIQAVGLSGQMHTSVFLDAAGKVIRPALLWCDGRTTAQCGHRRPGQRRQQLRTWVCNPPLEGFTLPKILWLRDNEPAAFARLAKVLLPKDYIRLRLTGDAGDASPPTPRGRCSSTWPTARWSARDARRGGAAAVADARVGGSTEVLGTVTAQAAAATGLAAGTPVVGGGADNACGAIGVGAVAPGAWWPAGEPRGRSSARPAAPEVDPGMRAHTFCHAVPGTWYVMGVMLSAGGAFAWHQRELARELAKKKDAAELLNKEAARIPSGAAGADVPSLSAGRADPHRDADARGAFVGLSWRTRAPI